jgi:hypothetical protein
MIRLADEPFVRRLEQLPAPKGSMVENLPLLQTVFRLGKISATGSNPSKEASHDSKTQAAI